MPGVGLIRSKLRPSRWLSPKSKQSFTKRRLLITASSKSFSARCPNSVSKSSSDRHRESANAPAANIPKVPYLSAIPLTTIVGRSTVAVLFQRASVQSQRCQHPDDRELSGHFPLAAELCTADGGHRAVCATYH